MKEPKPFVPEPQDVEDAGKYFRYMSEFVGFTEADADAIRRSGLVVEKHLPAIIGRFYTNLLQYPPTRKFFTHPDGTVDEPYLQLRMYHQANFWRRAAGGVYDDDFAHFVDYVGRAHTSRGADARLYIDQRYVIGMVGFVQHAVIDALQRELSEYDNQLAMNAIKAWNKLCMVILEMLARAYGAERDENIYQQLMPVDPQEIHNISVEAYEKGLGMRRRFDFKEVVVAQEDEIPEGERKIVQIDGLSIGVFHHKSGWYAIRNSCLHRGGPVATGRLIDDNVVCPWHGYTYDITTGRLLLDPTAKLDTYPVKVMDGQVVLRVPDHSAEEALSGTQTASRPGEPASPWVMDVPPAVAGDAHAVAAAATGITDPGYKAGEPGDKDAPVAAATDTADSVVASGGGGTAGGAAALKENEFRTTDLPPGAIKLVHVHGDPVAVYNVDGEFYATSDECTHVGGPLSEGELNGDEVVCPWHASCFNVKTGAATCPPAREPVKTYPVTVEGGIGRVEG